MKQQTKITLLYVITILSILNSFLIYYEIYRYAKIMVVKEPYYLNKYRDITNYNDKVIITVMVNSLNYKLTNTIKSILDQTISVNKIILYVAPDINKKYFEIYNSLNGRIVVTSFNESVKLNNSIIYTIKKTYENDTIIINLFQDVIYGKDFIDTILKTSFNNPTSIIYNKNALLYKQDFFDIKNIINLKVIPEDYKILNNATTNMKQIIYNENYPVL